VGYVNCKHAKGRKRRRGK